MLIWHQSYADLESFEHYRRRISSHAHKVCRDDVRIVAHGVPEQVADRDRHVSVQADEAQRAGADAFVLGCIYDPALHEVRARLDMPVLAMAETTTHLSDEHGARVGVVSLNSEDAERLWDLTGRYGRRDRVLEPVVLAAAIDEQEIEALGDTWSRPLLQSVERAFTDCVERGAESVVLAEGVLHEYVVAARFAGVRTPPCVDVFGVMWRRATEQATGLRESSGLFARSRRSGRVRS